MIEKLDLRENVEIIPIKGSCHDYCLAKSSVLIKINELVDAVNKLETMAKNTNTVLESLVQENNIHEKQIDELQMKLEPEKCEKPVGQYEKERKWIGCVCRFWCDNPNDTLLDYLDKIQTGKNGVEYYSKESGDWFPHCEPVLPTDNAIYKGEQ